MDNSLLFEKNKIMKVVVFVYTQEIWVNTVLTQILARRGYWKTTYFLTIEDTETKKVSLVETETYYQEGDKYP